MKLFEDVFQDLIDELRPQEVALRRSNADDLPIFARKWCRGGLKAIVDCDVEPPVTSRPGDPEWFRDAGVERRFISRCLLEAESVDAMDFAAQTGRRSSPAPVGYVFDGGWDTTWHASG